MAFWSTKAAISLKRVKIEKKLLWGAYRNAPSLFRKVPSPTPYSLAFPKLGVRTPPKTPIAIISGTGKATNFKFGQNNNSVHLNKIPIKILEKREHGRIQGLPNFFWYPLLSHEREKLRISNLASTFKRVHPNKSPLKILEKRESGRIQGLPIFSGTSYYPTNGKSYGFQIWPVYLEGPSEQKSIKNFGEKEALAYPGTAQFFRVPPIIS